MYATVSDSDASRYAASLSNDTGAEGTLRLDNLESQVCAEAGLWAPDVARQAISQSGGDTPRAVALLRVWAATLPHLEDVVLAEGDVHVTRRLSSAFAEIHGGQWLGRAPELASRMLTWEEQAPSGAAGSGAVPDPRPTSGAGSDAPTRAELPRVTRMLTDVLITDPGEEVDGLDPAKQGGRRVPDRPSALSLLANGETASLISTAAEILNKRREAVLAELSNAEVKVRIPHPRTGVGCAVATVPVVEAEAVVDAEVDGRTGFAVGWGASLGRIERRAIAMALLDGALQSDASLDVDEVLDAVDSSANNGFVEHLRLPHHASFASYLAQARAACAASQNQPTEGAS